LPGIVLHFAFDAFWFSMPLFASSAAGIRLQQILVVVAIFIPLWVLIVRRVQGGGAIDLAPEYRNGAWQPEPDIAREAKAAAPPALPASVALARPIVRSLVTLGALAALAWIAVVMLRPLQRHSIGITRTAASNAARAALDPAHRGNPWRFLSVADEGGGPSHRFVWETAGRSTYTSLLGTYLRLPGWTVFVRTFEGDVAERAETWTVYVDADGTVQRVSHTLPESRPGPSLAEAAARQLARRALTEKYRVDEASLEDVSVVPSKLPQRTDWTITFKDASRALPQGELRLEAQIAGDEIADLQRFVFVPEEWERTERNAETVASIVGVTGTVLVILMIIGGGIAAIVSWSRRQFVVRLFLIVCAAFLVLTAVRFVNGFPAVMASLSTAQPLQLQLLVLIASGVVGLGLQSGAMALIAGAVPAWSAGGRMDARPAVRLGLAIGAISAAARTVGAVVNARGPVWPSYSGATSFAPLAAAAINPTVTMLMRIVFFLLVVAVANRVTAGWTRRRALAGVLLAVVGGVLGAAGSPMNLAPWIASAAAIGALLVAVYVLVLRHDVSLVPIAVAVMTIAGTLREGSAAAYPGALAGAIAGVIVMGLAAFWWFRALRKSSERSPSSSVAV
jgi:hypothetical protein